MFMITITPHSGRTVRVGPFDTEEAAKAWLSNHRSSPLWNPASYIDIEREEAKCD